MEEENLVTVSRSNFSVTVENLKLEMTLVRESPAAKEIVQEKLQDLKEQMGELPLHEHNYNEIFVCSRGNTQILTENGILVLEEGDIVVIPPTYHHVKIYDKEEISGYSVVGFSFAKRHNKDGYDLFQVFSQVFHKRFPVMFHGKLELCDEIIQLSKWKSDQKTYFPALQLVQVLAKLAETSDVESEDVFKMAECIEPSASSKDIDRMMILEGLVDSHYMKDLTVEKVAEQMYLSPRQLTRIIRKRYGATLHQILVKKRLEVAERMLIKTELSAEEIGIKVGFHTKTVFYNEFRKKHGVPPRIWRHENKE